MAHSSNAKDAATATISAFIIMEELEQVRARLMQCIDASSLRPIAGDLAPCVAGGKMLRARLLLRLGAATRSPIKRCIEAAAAVELVHAASLLHDDVIDQGRLRRGEPTLWVKEGIRAAIILGDLMVCEAFGLVQGLDDSRLPHVLTEVAREMCEAEAQQELLLRDEAPSWDTCVEVARRKTGSLFSFAAYAAADSSNGLGTTLREAGYAVGTAYQLADDVFDAFGDPFTSNKTLGLDASDEKLTAVSAGVNDGIDPAAHVRSLCDTARESLAPWPHVQAGWDDYMQHDMGPALDAFLSRAQVETSV